MTVGVVALAQTPTRRQRIAAIDKQLASGDGDEIHRGLAAIDAAIALDRFMAIEGSGFGVRGLGFRVQGGAMAKPAAMTKSEIRSPNQWRRTKRQ